MQDNEATITIRANTEQLKAAFASAVTATKSMSKTISSELDDVRQAGDRAGESIDNFRTSIMAGMRIAGTAIAAAVGTSIFATAQFKDSLSVLQYATKGSAEDMRALTDAAIQLGRDMSLPKVSAKNAADAMIELGKAGLSTADVIAASKPVIALAVAGHMEYAEAASTVAAALGAFRLSGSDATKVADALAGGADASRASIQSLALGLSQSAGVAAKFGVTMQDNIAALSLLASKGLDGSDAGTSLKTMLMSLAAPSKESAAAMKAIGFSAFDAKGKFVGLEEVSRRLSKGLSGLTDQQKNSALATIFGSDASRAAGFIADAAGKQFTDMQDAVNKTGVANNAASSTSTGLSRSLSNLQKTAQDVGLTYGDKLQKPLTKFVDFANSNLGPTAKFVADNIGTITTAIAALAATFATVRMAGFISDIAKANSSLELFVGAKNANGLKAIASGIRNAAIGSKMFGSAAIDVTKHNLALSRTYIQYGLLRAQQAALSIGTKAVTAGQWLLNAALTANPIGLIIVGIVALIAGMVLLWKNSETFRNIVTGAFNIVWGVIKFVWDWVSQNWPLLLAILTGPIGWATYAIIQNWDTIKAAFAAAWQFIQSVWGNVAGWFASVWQGIVNAFSAAGSFFYNVFAGAWNGIKSVFSAVGGFFQGIWNGIVGIFGNIGAAVGNGIAGAVKGVINSILSGAESIINGFISAINGAIKTINRIPGVRIGNLGYLNLPRLATGGIVPATPGGQMITVAEGGQSEWVVPESKMASLISQINARAAAPSNKTPSQTFNFSFIVQNDGTDFTEVQAIKLARLIVRALRSQGLAIDEMGALR